MEKCAKCGESYTIHNIDEKLARRICACENAKSCQKKSGCSNPVTQAELITGAPTIVKKYLCDEHGYEECRAPIAPVVEVISPAPVAVEAVASPPAIEVAPETAPVVTKPKAKKLTQLVGENCYVAVELDLVTKAVEESGGEVDCYVLSTRGNNPMNVVTCVKCSDSHTLRSRTPVVVVDEKTNLGVHRTICPKCDESGIFLIAPVRLDL